MALGLIILIVAAVLVIIDLVLWNTVRGWGRHLLTPIALLMVVIYLLVSSGQIH